MNRINVKVVKIHDDATIPTYGSPWAAGFDLYTVRDVVIPPGHTTLIKTGLKIQVPEGYELQIRPRSGMSLKTTFRIANSPGTVDADYTGEICIIGHNIANHDDDEIFISKGDRVAQGVIAPIKQANFKVIEELSETKRGSGGFGSTGK